MTDGEEEGAMTAEELYDALAAEADPREGVNLLASAIRAAPITTEELWTAATGGI